MGRAAVAPDGQERPVLLRRPPVDPTCYTLDCVFERADVSLDLSSTEYTTFVRHIKYASGRAQTESPGTCKKLVQDMGRVLLEDARTLASCLVPKWAGLHESVPCVNVE